MKRIMTLAAALSVVCSAALAQSSNPYADGAAAAPDEWLLVKKVLHRFHCEFSFTPAESTFSN
jgi:hypothetical protein